MPDNYVYDRSKDPHTDKQVTQDAWAVNLYDRVSLGLNVDFGGMPADLALHLYKIIEAMRAPEYTGCANQVAAKLQCVANLIAMEPRTAKRLAAQKEAERILRQADQL